MAGHDLRMSVTPLPYRGGVQFDRRDGDRVVRVAPHPEQGFMTLSIWRGDVCVATHQMTTQGAAELIALLANAAIVVGEGTSPVNASAG
jgi:hypothetical protein